MRILGVLLLSTLLPALASAAPAPPAEPFRPARVHTPPAIDGVLDDAAWQAATQSSNFKTWRPDYGKEPRGKTTVYAAYDAENMYFAFRALDEDPSKIKASMASRDSIRPDDWICINLDSFGDQQALYGFYVNPLGIQMDSRYAANKEDIGFDAVWYSAGRIDAQGYIVEVRIPFKSIRYSGREPVMMGVIFERNDSRRAEGSMDPPIDPRAGYNFTIQMRPIAFDGIKHYTLLEVLPDATYSRQEQAREGALLRTAGGGDVGATVKYGLTAQLTVDGTYNPDFSQVEADAGQIDVNLRHPLFFAEKRPFFLEGNEVFNIAGPTQYGVLLVRPSHAHDRQPAGGREGDREAREGGYRRRAVRDRRGGGWHGPARCAGVGRPLQAIVEPGRVPRRVLRGPRAGRKPTTAWRAGTGR